MTDYLKDFLKDKFGNKSPIHIVFPVLTHLCFLIRRPRQQCSLLSQLEYKAQGNRPKHAGRCSEAILMNQSKQRACPNVNIKNWWNGPLCTPAVKGFQSRSTFANRVTEQYLTCRHPKQTFNLQIKFVPALRCVQIF